MSILPRARLQIHGCKNADSHEKAVLTLHNDQEARARTMMLYGYLCLNEVIENKDILLLIVALIAGFVKEGRIPFLDGDQFAKVVDTGYDYAIHRVLELGTWLYDHEEVEDCIEKTKLLFSGDSLATSIRITTLDIDKVAFQDPSDYFDKKDKS